MQYTYIASLMISLSGDVATNPGWCDPRLSKPGLKIGHLNVRSLLHENPLDVLCLNETWLNCSWRDAELAIEGYSLVRNDRKDERRGGGTAIYYKSNFIARSRADICPNDIETTWLEITLPNKHKILISSLYRPPNANIINFNTNLENLFDSVCSDKEILVLGDLNCDLAAKTLSSDTKELCKSFNIYQFKQLIKEFTRIAENSSTLLDLVFTTDSVKITDSGVIDCSISDHTLVYVVRRAKIPKGQIKTIRYRSFRTYSAEQFISDLHNISWDFIETSLTVEEAWVSFKKTLLSLIDKHDPMCLKRVRGNTLPWINYEIRTLMMQRNFRYKKAKNSGLINDWRAYK